MKKSLLISLCAALFAFMVTTGASFAEEKSAPMGGSMMMGDGTTMKAHQDLAQDMMQVMKDLTGIVKNLKHTPTDDDKKKLTEIGEKLDKMMKAHKEILEKRQEMMEKRREEKKDDQMEKK